MSPMRPHGYMAVEQQVHVVFDQLPSSSEVQAQHGGEGQEPHQQVCSLSLCCLELGGPVCAQLQGKGAAGACGV